MKRAKPDDPMLERAGKAARPFYRPGFCERNYELDAAFATFARKEVARALRKRKVKPRRQPRIAHICRVGLGNEYGWQENRRGR